MKIVNSVDQRARNIVAAGAEVRRTILCICFWCKYLFLTILQPFVWLLLTNCCCRDFWDNAYLDKVLLLSSQVALVRFYPNWMLFPFRSHPLQKTDIKISNMLVLQKVLEVGEVFSIDVSCIAALTPSIDVQIKNNAPLRRAVFGVHLHSLYLHIYLFQWEEDSDFFCFVP